MKNLFKSILHLLEWVIYYMGTHNARVRYTAGINKGMHCVEARDVGIFIPGNTMDCYYDPTRKPEREYVTFKEFWAGRNSRPQKHECSFTVPYSEKYKGKEYHFLVCDQCKTAEPVEDNWKPDISIDNVKEIKNFTGIGIKLNIEQSN